MRFIRQCLDGCQRTDHLHTSKLLVIWIGLRLGGVKKYIICGLLSFVVGFRVVYDCVCFVAIFLTMKPYRYLIYKLYTWGLRRPGDTPVLNVVLTLSIVHLFYALMIWAVSSKVFGFGGRLNFNRGILFLGILGFFYLNYLVLYNGNRWQAYVEEFKDESPTDKRNGTIRVLVYLIGSFFLFMLTLVLVFGA